MENLLKGACVVAPFDDSEGDALVETQGCGLRFVGKCLMLDEGGLVGELLAETRFYAEELVDGGEGIAVGRARGIMGPGGCDGF